MSNTTPTPPPASRGARRKHRPRRERDPNVRVVITDRDRAVFRLFTVLRIATMEHLAPLLAHEFGDPFNLQTRLRPLYDTGYLARPAGQDFRPTSVKRKRGRQPDIYALGNRGAAELRARGMELPKTDYDAKADALKPLSFDHLFATSDAVAAFLLAFRASQAAELLDVLPDGKFSSHVMVPIRGRSVRFPIKPDTTFLVREAGNLSAFFLEVDLETMPNTRTAYEQSSFLKKAIGYLAYYRQRRVRAELGAETFSVLTVTNSHRHAEALRLTTHRADAESRGSDVFWFTTFGQLRAAEPTNPLTGAIWTTAAGGEAGRLL